MKKDSDYQKQNVVSRVLSLIGIIICIILVPVLVMNLVIIAKSYINPNKVPDFFGIKPFVVLSGSMEPAILTGDLVIVKTVDPAQLKVNDIISFKEGNSVTTHRIVELTESAGQPAFITQGDANNAADRSAIVYSQVEGVYLFKINKLGNLAMFMQTPMGLFIFVGIPLCGFILYDILRRKFADRTEKSALKEAQAEIERLKAALNQKQNNGDTE